jgi:hypothetical protein
MQLSSANFLRVSPFYFPVVSSIVEALCPVVLRKQRTVLERVEPMRSVQKGCWSRRLGPVELYIFSCTRTDRLILCYTTFCTQLIVSQMFEEFFRLWVQKVHDRFELCPELLRRSSRLSLAAISTARPQSHRLCPAVSKQIFMHISRLRSQPPPPPPVSCQSM